VPSLQKERERMSIFNINKQVCTSTFGIYGTVPKSLYDINGNVLNSASLDRLTVMSYNIQNWTGINANPTILDEIFRKYNPDIVGLQEYQTNAKIDGISGDTFLRGYWDNLNICDTETPPYAKAIASKHKLYRPSTIYYSSYVQSRSMQRVYLDDGKKRIAVINTHIDYLNHSIQKSQAKQLLDAVANEEYFIIVGDLNTGCESVEENDYTDVMKPFVDAGYNCANCTPETGFLGTWTDGTNATNGTWEPTDNIITSANISIEQVILDETKILANTGLEIDHIPLIARLKIN
jgi:endonuclease/exonuclease/phosphatase family metal-dependent hydrolase